MYKRQAQERKITVEKELLDGTFLVPDTMPVEEMLYKSVSYTHLLQQLVGGTGVAQTVKHDLLKLRVFCPPHTVRCV